MQISSPIPQHQVVGKTFMVAISVLGVVAFAELSAIGWALASKFHPTPPDTASAASAEPALPTGTPAPAFTDPFATATNATATASPAPTTTEQTVASLPKPTPILQPAPTTESRINELIQQARALRENGDTSTAVTRLREGLTIAPDNALLTSELATTYEKMGLDQKALEQWRRIYDMGESAGIYYAAADAKLKNSEITTRPVASPTMAEGSQAPPAPQSTQTSQGTGFQPGSVLGLVNMQIVEQSEPNALKKFTLKIPLKARANTKIDVSDVVIQVFFYDQLADGNVVQTNANVSSHWSTLPADWADDDGLEILEVEYTQPKSEKLNESRHYHGYVVRVYYKKELQDMRADPVALLKKYPPPLTLQTGEGQ